MRVAASTPFFDRLMMLNTRSVAVNFASLFFAGTFLAADRLREIVEKERFEGESKMLSGKITLSLGITSFPDFGESVEEILSDADNALYHAKELGRNRTVLFSEDLRENRA